MLDLMCVNYRKLDSVPEEKAKEGESKMESNEQKGIYSFTMKDIDGKDVSLSDYKGKVVMIVNVASKCGATPQYEQLQSLYEKYKDNGFVVLGFPANDFLGQEPGTNEQIKTFCSTKYNVTFPMFSKIKVRGKDIHPLYRYLTEEIENEEYRGKITWNFNKFLVDRAGKVCYRIPTKTKPNSEEALMQIETAIAN